MCQLLPQSQPPGWDCPKLAIPGGDAAIYFKCETVEFNRFVEMYEAADMGRVDFFVALMDAYDEREQLRAEIARLQKVPGAA